MRSGRAMSVAVSGVALGVLLAAGASGQSPAPGGPGLLGAVTEIWRDDLSAPSTWDAVSDDVGVTAYDEANGQLLMSVTGDRSSVWDDHVLDEAHAVLRVEAWVAVNGAGAAGVACGSSHGLPRWLWAGIDGNLGWAFGRIIDTRLQVLQRGELPLEAGADGRRATLAIECASDPASGGDHAVVTANGVYLAGAFDIPVGPYDKATLVVTADNAPVRARFDDVVVHAGETYLAPAPSAPPEPAG